MIRKILGLFFNTLTGNEKYSVLNGENLEEHLHIQLSQKRKTFSGFVFAFSKFRFNFEHFQTKDARIADSFFDLGTPKNVAR